MSECPQPRLQALRWAFQQTLQATAKLPSFSEFQSHFPGQGTKESCCIDIRDAWAFHGSQIRVVC